MSRWDIFDAAGNFVGELRPSYGQDGAFVAGCLVLIVFLALASVVLVPFIVIWGTWGWIRWWLNDWKAGIPVFLMVAIPIGFLGEYGPQAVYWMSYAAFLLLGIAIDRSIQASQSSHPS